MATSKFPSSNVRYKDTRGAGTITVAGFEMAADKDGFIEAPPSFAEDLFPHGFLRADSVEYSRWLASQGGRR